MTLKRMGSGKIVYRLAGCCASRQSAGGPAHSKTLRAVRQPHCFAPAFWSAAVLCRFPSAKHANEAQIIFPCRHISRGSRLARLIHIFNLFPMAPIRQDKIISKSLSDLAFGVRVWGDGLIQH